MREGWLLPVDGSTAEASPKDEDCPPDIGGEGLKLPSTSLPPSERRTLELLDTALMPPRNC